MEKLSIHTILSKIKAIEKRAKHIQQRVLTEMSLLQKDKIKLKQKIESINQLQQQIGNRYVTKEAVMYMCDEVENDDYYKY